MAPIRKRFGVVALAALLVNVLTAPLVLAPTLLLSLRHPHALQLVLESKEQLLAMD